VTSGCTTLTNQNASAHPILNGAVILMKSRSFAKGGNKPAAGVGVDILKATLNVLFQNGAIILAQTAAGSKLQFWQGNLH
jgi:hypothetical protein